jgi:hypothetical protein
MCCSHLSELGTSEKSLTASCAVESRPAGDAGPHPSPLIRITIA